MIETTYPVLSIPAYGSWQPIDVSSYLTADAGGVILQPINATSVAITVAFRHGDSVDSVVGDLRRYSTQHYHVGINDSNLVDAYVGTSNVEVRLAGYYLKNACSFLSAVGVLPEITASTLQAVSISSIDGVGSSADVGMAFGVAELNCTDSWYYHGHPDLSGGYPFYMGGEGKWQTWFAPSVSTHIGMGSELGTMISVANYFGGYLKSDYIGGTSVSPTYYPTFTAPSDWVTIDLSAFPSGATGAYLKVYGWANSTVPYYTGVGLGNYSITSGLIAKSTGAALISGEFFTEASFWVPLDSTRTIRAQSGVSTFWVLVYGYSTITAYEFTPVFPVDKIGTEYLAASGGNKFFYGQSPTTMQDFTAVNNLDHTNGFDMTAAYQKIFIANESVLGVADFGTVKLVTTNVGSSAVPERTTLLTGQTSGAKGTVDYITASSAADVYLYVTTTAAFVSGEILKSDAALSVSFTITQAANTGPHYYAWGVHAGNATTYGALPTKATLIARYRGRLVLSGNPGAPYQWYASRVNGPFDFQYSATNPLSAIAGNNGDAGEVGDIVNALIPYNDDFLVFGCRNSIHLMTGDPMQGGSIDEVSNMTGIWGKHAWCKDNDGNLYFYGSGGIYVMAGGRGMPQNISIGVLPDLVESFAPVISADRVSLVYDNNRHGLILAKTAITSGTNTNYYMDLTNKSVFPEEYPANGALMCGEYFSSPGGSQLLLGSWDGYIREFKDTAKDDDNGTTDATITSYVGWVEPMTAPEDDTAGKITELVVETAGGASSGGFTDTDTVKLSIFTGDNAETVMEDMIDGATAFLTISMVSAGRQSKIRQNVRSKYVGFEFRNNTSGETWAVNKMFGNIEPSGPED